jgi:hypothetical protein
MNTNKSPKPSGYEQPLSEINDEVARFKKEGQQDLKTNGFVLMNN